MSPFYVKLFIPFLRCSHSLDEIKLANIEVIIVASYCAKSPTELAAATRANLEKAVEFKKTICPNALIVFASCSHAFPSAHLYEQELKARMCNEAKVSFSYVGPIVNSITEMEAVKYKLLQRFLHPDRILVVTCELHSEAEHTLGKMVFPSARIWVYANSHELEVEADHPVKDQASWPRWFKASIMRLIAFKLASCGLLTLDYLRKHQHQKS